MNSTNTTTTDVDLRNLYGYDPSIALNVISLILFVIGSVIVGYLNIKSRHWYMMPVMIGGLIEAVGFAARTYSGSDGNTGKVGPYIAATLPILVAPTILAISDYNIVGRM